MINGLAILEYPSRGGPVTVSDPFGPSFVEGFQNKNKNYRYTVVMSFDLTNHGVLMEGGQEDTCGRVPSEECDTPSEDVTSSPRPEPSIVKINWKASCTRRK